MDTNIKITFERTVRLPTVPNFIFVHPFSSDNNKVSIGDLTDEELRRIGKEWTEALLRRAQEVRHDQDR